MLAAGKDSALLRFSLGNEYLKASDAARAAEHLERAVALDPKYTAAWKLYGKALVDAGRTADALAAYRTGIDVARAKGTSRPSARCRCSCAGSSVARSSPDRAKRNPGTPLPDRIDAAIGERVGALIADVARVALHPVPANPMLRREHVQLAPQLGILHRLPIARAPAVALPGVNPALDAVLDVLRIGVELDVALAAQRFERANDRGELHPVVRGIGLAAEQLLFATSEREQRTPAAGTRIALACAVGVDRDGGASGYSIDSRT
jgi:tetratricopeptide (TPR) repeat protein